MIKPLLVGLLAVGLIQVAHAQTTFPKNGVYDERPGLYAFTNATIIIDPQTTLTNATLLIRNGRIEAVGQSVKLPAGTVTTDLEGKRIYEAVDLPYRLPGILQKAGVLVSLSYAGEWWRTRNLPFQAGTAVGFGVTDSEEALKMITSNTARILGIADKVGTLEPGKHATLFVSAGDALDMRTNRVERVSRASHYQLR